MRYTQIPADTFETLQMNAGIMLTDFDPSDGSFNSTDLIGATTGGLSFQDNMSFKDFGEDIDNCPKNMKELKKLDQHDVKISGTMVTMNPKTAHLLAAAADVDAQDASHIIPRNDLDINNDFQDIWLVADYSSVNDGDNAGFVAIRLMNALNTGGFQIKTSDKAKGQFAFEFTGHYSMQAQDTVPYELYVRAGEDGPSVKLNKNTLALAVGDDPETLTATVVPSGTAVTWTTSDDTVATVSNGAVTAVAAGTATITATITVEGQNYTDTCAVTVSE